MKKTLIGALCVMMVLFVGCVEDLGLNNTPANSGGVQVTDPTTPNYGDPTSWPEDSPYEYEIGDGFITQALCIDKENGHFFFVGTTDALNDSFWTVAMDEAGTLLFDPVLIGTDDRFDRGMAVSYCATGYQTVRSNDIEGTGGADEVFLEEWTFDGQLNFSRELLSELGVLQCYAVGFYDARVYIAGLTQGFGYIAYFDIADSAFSHVMILHGLPVDIMFNSNGDVVVGGTTSLGMVPGKPLNGESDFFAAAYNPDLTAPRWTAQLSWPLRQRDGFSALYNDVVVVGGAAGDPLAGIGYSALVTAYDALSGDSLWVAANDSLDPVVDISGGDNGFHAVTASSQLQEGVISAVSDGHFYFIKRDYAWFIQQRSQYLFYVGGYHATLMVHDLGTMGL